jgi:hypothetical protein
VAHQYLLCQLADSRWANQSLSFLLSLLELHTAQSGVLRPFDRSHTHNQVTQPPEMTTLQGLGHKISHHILGGAPFDLNFLHVDPVIDEKVMNIDVPSTFTT